jgi:hypothetical protein
VSIGSVVGASQAKLDITQSMDGGNGIALHGTGTAADGYAQMYIETANNAKALTINSSAGTNYRVGGNLLTQFRSDGVMNIYGGTNQSTNRLGFGQTVSM